MNEVLDKLVDDIRLKGYSMVEKFGFTSIYDEKDKIDAIDGDIVECGVWKGGMCVFLTKLFPNKKIWVVDSFSGFEKVEESTYPTELWDNHKIKEPHVFGYGIRIATHSPLDEVKSVFEEYGELNNPNINFLEGYVKDTLKPEICPIQNIALLRIDVDSYSATMNVLDYLYPKVVSGGMIIFDDGNIDAGRFAIYDYFEKNKMELISICPTRKCTIAGISACSYIIKK